MRARVAALRTTHGRIGELIERYGVEVFIAAQEGIIEYVERVVRRRLGEIPDGSWFAHGYHDHDGVSDAHLPDLLPADEGRATACTSTSPAPRRRRPGPINCARPALEGAIMGVILTLPLPRPAVGDRRPAPARARSRCRTARSSAPLSPAAVSMASIMATLSVQDVVARAFAEMLLCSPSATAARRWRAGARASAAAPTPRRRRRHHHDRDPLRELRRRRRRAHLRRRHRQRRRVPLDGVADRQRRGAREPRPPARALPPRGARRRRRGALPRRRRARVRVHAAQGWRARRA